MGLIFVFVAGFGLCSIPLILGGIMFFIVGMIKKKKSMMLLFPILSIPGVIILLGCILMIQDMFSAF